MRVARKAKSRNSLRIQEPDQGELAVPGAARWSSRPSLRTQERRAYARARMALSLSVCRVAGQPSSQPVALSTVDISPSGAFFLYPQRIDPGTPLLIEVAFLEQRRRHRAVRMRTDAHVVRAEAAGKPGWHGLAVAFDEISYVRDEHLLAGSGLAVAPPRS